MNRQRYEPVQQQEHETIDLDPLVNTSYQYNTGLPSSVGTTTAPSYPPPSIRSIQTSPPPSFHTLSRTGTPRANLRGGEVSELWGVATSTGALTEAICTGSETLEEIQNLKARIARLEESIGRLLLDKEGSDKQGSNHHCCVTFTDASPDLERVIARSGDHCCVSFNSSRAADAKRESAKYGAIAIMVLFILVLSTVLIITSTKQRQSTLDLNRN